MKTCLRSETATMEYLSNPKRKEILVSAGKLFAKKGFARTKVDEIAALAKVGKGTVYLYFENKERIFQATIEEGLAELHRQIGLILTGPDGYHQKLKLIVGKYLQFMAQNKEVVQSYLNEHSNVGILQDRKASRQIHEAYQGLYRLLEDYFQEGIRQGYFRSGNARHYTLALTGMIKGVAWDITVDSDRTKRSNYVGIILDIFMAGVRNPEFNPPAEEEK